MKIKTLFLIAEYQALFVFCCLVLTFLTASSVSAAAVRAGFNANSLPANDDGSTSAVPLGFSVDFFGTTYSSVYVNNNGNISFNEALPAHTPGPFGDIEQPVIAPFWADIDTRGSGSNIVRYGTGVINGRNAFGVSWINVGYFVEHFDKLNSFQLIIIDRSDRAMGAFDIEFNYDGVLWETGDSSGGTNGLGGSSARAGFSDGTVNDFELLGSGVNGGFLNSNTNTGLINKSRNSTVLGRYVFEFPLQAKVTKVEYEQINGGISPMDANPNAGGGRRIYPDKDTPADGFDRRKIRVKAQYGLNSAGVRIYFRNFDLDDPSATGSGNAVDNETSPTGNDNRGDAGIPQAGLLSVPNPNSNDCQPFTGGVSCLTDVNGVATVDFTTTKRPGDNFTVAASANETYIKSLVISADGINLKDNNNVQTPVTIPPNNNTCATTLIRACRADMLTVWRRLHIEVDRMGQVTANHISGTIIGAVMNPGFTVIQINANLEDHRFEPGTVNITGSGNFNVINSSTNEFVIDDELKPGNIIGKNFTLYDDDDYNNDDISNNGDENEIDVATTSFTFLKMQTSDLVSQNVYASAYYMPIYDGGGSLNNNGIAPFDLNVTFAEELSQTTGSIGSAGNEDDNFWVAYVQTGYQPDLPNDRDPDTDYGIVPDDTIVGITTSVSSDSIPSTCLNVPRGGKGSIIFQETIRDVFTVISATDDSLTAPHELGHQLGLEGDSPNKGIMGSDALLPNYFIPEHLHILRCRVTSPTF